MRLLLGHFEQHLVGDRLEELAGSLLLLLEQLGLRAGGGIGMHARLLIPLRTLPPTLLAGA